ncbi:uncharacterized protein LOC142495331 [Ascaphus truei]|uniref:uncharacterized protein LOC142495331 n=1 Tax=Ascaphus truei TaxID=8439 RepID=UPI003F59C887
MDFAGKESKRLANAARIFSITDNIVDLTQHPSVTSDQDQIRELTLLMRKRLRVWWNKIALCNYLDYKMIPRGLRIQTFPSFAFNDPGLKERWECALNTCSVELINTLIVNDEASLTETTSAIDSLRKDMEYMDKSVFDTIEIELDKYEGEIELMKKGKFDRDLSDYKLGKVYKWSHSKPGYRKKKRNLKSGTSVSAGSTTSEMDSSDCDTVNPASTATGSVPFLYQGPMGTGGGGRGGGARSLRDRDQFGYKFQRGKHQRK